MDQLAAKGVAGGFERETRDRLRASGRIWLKAFSQARP
jgi:hypothetical protein